jgi:hypothetical protein
VLLADADPQCRNHCGGDEGRILARRIEACPSPGVEYWLVRTRLLLPSSHSVASATAGAAPQLLEAPYSCTGVHTEWEMCFERAVVLHGHESAALWVAWVRFRRRAGLPAGRQMERAVAALQGADVDAFLAEVHAGAAVQAA